MVKELGKTDFILPEEVIAQLKNGIRALHEGGLWHNDLHLGNIVVRDGDLENPRLYGIDFEDATYEKKTINDAEGEYYLSDENIVNLLEPLRRTRP